MSLKILVSTLPLMLGVCLQLQAMERWSALSQIESADDDRAIGRAGEVSRYQMRPEVWQRYAPKNANWENPKEALLVAKVAMRDRCDEFERSFHRPPTDFEFYVLWNAPAQVQRPGSAVTERAKRFCNLIDRRENSGSLTDGA